MGNCYSKKSDTIELVANDVLVLNNAQFEDGFDKKSKLKKRNIRIQSRRASAVTHLEQNQVQSKDPATGEYLVADQQNADKKSNPTMIPAKFVTSQIELNHDNETLDKATPLPFELVSQNYDQSFPSPNEQKKTVRIGKRTTPLACHFGLPNIGRMASFENEFSPVVTDCVVVNGNTYPFTLSDLISENNCEKLGSGGFGVVTKLRHAPSDVVMAVKRVQIQVDVGLKRELDTLDDVRNKGSPFIVGYYGSLKHNGDVWIAMELMKNSMDNIKLKVFEENKSTIPIHIIWFVSYCICSALNFLKMELQIIHRDVKPSNMLVGEDGSVKICDFGISGPLVESKAKTNYVGCRPYMAPERFDPIATHYTVQADVWSFGISMMEMVTGSFPYSKSTSYFDQWNQVVMGDPPQLEASVHCPQTLVDFINPCLNKESKLRPFFKDLLQFPSIKEVEYDESKLAMVEWMQIMNI